MFQAIGQFIVSASLALAGFFGYHQALLGSAVYIPAPRYESSLAQSMSATQTSTMYLVSGVDGNGETLTGNMCFTIDAGVANTVEDVCGNASGTQVSNLIRGIDTSGFTASSTLAHAHRVGADVKITDSPYLAQYSAFLNGTQSLPNPLIYNASNTPTVVGANILNLASVGYVNSTTYSGAPNGSASVKGIYQEATGAQIASGTTSGSTGADLALTTNVTATSSKANSIVTTNASGTLDPSFVSNGNYSLGSTTVSNLTITGTVSGAVPVGTLEAYVSSTAPTGWLSANGQSVATATYPNLFALIGYAYGGSTSTFNLPNLGGRFLAGASSSLSSTIGATGGSFTGTSTIVYTPNQITGYPFNSITTSNGGGGGQGLAWAFNSSSTQLSVSGTSQVISPYFIVNYIIKY